MNVKKMGRNDPCFCGSGKKYKHCCLLTQAQKKYKPWNPQGWIVGLYYFFLGIAEGLDDLSNAADVNRRRGTGKHLVKGEAWCWPPELVAGFIVFVIVLLFFAIILFGIKALLVK
jgi:hypothetical protein